VEELRDGLAALGASLLIAVLLDALCILRLRKLDLPTST